MLGAVAKYPEAAGDRLEGVAVEDLTCCQLSVLIRRLPS
jgi:hypothetical protein